MVIDSVAGFETLVGGTDAFGQESSRRERIALGSGVQVYDVNQLLKQFADMRKMMKQFQSASGKGRKRMRLPGMPGGM